MNQFNMNEFIEKNKGFFYIFGGILILLYAFGFFAQWLNIAVIGGGIGLIIYGLYQLGTFEKIKELTKKE